MEAAEIIKQARRLVADSRVEEARDLLLKAGFADTPDSDIQQAYSSIIPVNPILKQRLAGCLAQLKSADPKARLQASKLIEREARDLPSDERDAWLKDPRTTEIIIGALDDSDLVVIENAVIAVTEIARRYFRDIRAYPGVVRLLKSSRITTRSWACRGAAYLGRQSSFPALLPLFQDKSAKVRLFAIRAIGLLQGDVFSPATRQLFRKPLFQALKDKDPEVRLNAAGGFRVLGYDDVVDDLQKALLKERDGMVQDALKTTINDAKAKRATSRAVKSS